MKENKKRRSSDKTKITHGMLTGLNKKLKNGTNNKQSRNSSIVVKSEGKTYTFRELG